MKLQKNIFFAFLALMLLSLAVLLKIDNHSKIYNIFLSIFTGALIVTISSIVSYFYEREKFLYTIKDYILNYYISLCMTMEQRKLMLRQDGDAILLKFIEFGEIKDVFTVTLPLFRSDTISQAKFNFFSHNLNKIFKNERDNLQGVILKRDISAAKAVQVITKKGKIDSHVKDHLEKLYELDLKLLNELRAFSILIDRYFKIDHEVDFLAESQKATTP